MSEKNNVELKFFIYLYTFPNGKHYVGQTSTQQRRYGLSSKYRTSPVVYKAMKKYPNYKKEILQYCKEEELDNLEIYYIKKYKSLVSENGYNVSSGGYSLKKGNIPWNKGLHNCMPPPANKGIPAKEWLSPENFEKCRQQAIVNCRNAVSSGHAGFKEGHEPWNKTVCYLIDTKTSNTIHFSSIKDVMIYIGNKNNKNSGRYCNKNRLIKGRYYLRKEVIL